MTRAGSVELLPYWVYDLIDAVQEFEETHSAGGACLEAALLRVPQPQRHRATAISHYHKDRTLAEELDDE